jgi:hypothetical protein
LILSLHRDSRLSNSGDVIGMFGLKALIFVIKVFVLDRRRSQLVKGKVLWGKQQSSIISDDRGSTTARLTDLDAWLETESIIVGQL